MFHNFYHLKMSCNLTNTKNNLISSHLKNLFLHFPNALDCKCALPHLVFSSLLAYCYIFSIFFLPRPPSLSGQRPGGWPSLACGLFSLLPSPGGIIFLGLQHQQPEFLTVASIPAHLEAIWSSAMPTWPLLLCSHVPGTRTV